MSEKLPMILIVTVLGGIGLWRGYKSVSGGDSEPTFSSYRVRGASVKLPCKEKLDERESKVKCVDKDAKVVSEFTVSAYDPEFVIPPENVAKMFEGMFKELDPSMKVLHESTQELSSIEWDIYSISAKDGAGRLSIGHCGGQEFQVVVFASNGARAKKYMLETLGTVQCDAGYEVPTDNLGPKLALGDGYGWDMDGSSLIYYSIFLDMLVVNKIDLNDLPDKAQTSPAVWEPILTEVFAPEGAVVSFDRGTTKGTLRYLVKYDDESQKDVLLRILSCEKVTFMLMAVPGAQGDEQVAEALDTARCPVDPQGDPPAVPPIAQVRQTSCDGGNAWGCMSLASDEFWAGEGYSESGIAHVKRACEMGLEFACEQLLP